MATFPSRRTDRSARSLATRTCTGAVIGTLVLTVSSALLVPGGVLAAAKPAPKPTPKPVPARGNGPGAYPPGKYPPAGSTPVNTKKPAKTAPAKKAAPKKK